MGNPFVHIDLSCDDPAAAKKFYASVFDWSFEDFPGMDWSGVRVGEGTGGGIGGKQGEGATAWTAYVGVDDVRATMARAHKAGATILVEYMEIPGMGALGVFVDPQGATLGVWQNVAPPPPAAKKTAPAKKPAAPAKKAPARKPAAPAKKAPAKKPAGKKPGKK